jgi:hypothetical protein
MARHEREYRDLVHEWLVHRLDRGPRQYPDDLDRAGRKRRLMRVRAARIDVIEQMLPIQATQEPDVTRSASVSRHEAANNLSCLKQLMTLDGYERRALSRRKRALRSLFPTIAQ